MNDLGETATSVGCFTVGCVMHLVMWGLGAAATVFFGVLVLQWLGVIQ